MSAGLNWAPIVNNISTVVHLGATLGVCAALMNVELSPVPPCMATSR